MKRKIFIIILYLSLFLGLISDKSVKANLLDLQKVKPGGKEMTQNFQVRLSMNQAAIVKSGLVLKQGDFGMNLDIEVLNFDTSNTTPQIVFRKPMGAVESTSVTKSGNVYTYTLRGTELDTPGKVICDLKLKNSTTQRISTASFSFEVAADTLDGLAEEASSYSDTIAQIASTLQSFSLDSEAWAKGTKDGVPVTDTDEQYENNSKFYSDLCQASTGALANAVANLSETVEGYQGAVDNIENILAIDKSASGKIVKITDAVVGHTASVTGVNNYTVSGKNLFNVTQVDGEERNGVKVHIASDGGITVSGTSTGANVFTLGEVTLPAGTYTVKSWNNTSYAGNLLIQIRDTDGTTYDQSGNTTPRTFTLAATKTIVLRIYFPSGQTYTESGALWYPQIELGSSSTTYAPYQGNTYTTSTFVIPLETICVWGNGSTLSVDYQELSSNVTKMVKIVNTSNVADVLPDANAAIDGYYFLVYAGGDTNIPENLPVKTVSATVGLLLTYGSDQANVATQFYYDLAGMYFRRKKTASEWDIWVKYQNNEIYVGNSDNLYEAVLKAIKTPNSKVYVSGTHNLITEMGGTSVIESKTAEFGIPLSNGVEIIGIGNATVELIYEGSSTNVRGHVTPFLCQKDSLNPGFRDYRNNNYTIKNLSIKSKNTRYAIHDDTNNFDVGGLHIIENVKISHTTDDSRYTQAIGCGLSKSTVIIIKDSYIESNAPDTKGTVSVHNSSRSDALGKFEISGTYLSENFRAGYYGDSTDVTPCYIHNCSLGAENILVSESGLGTVVNMEIINWNNQIRSN